MANAFFMAVIDGDDNLLEKPIGLGAPRKNLNYQITCLLNSVKKLAAIAILYNQIDMVGVFVRFEEFYQVRMVQLLQLQSHFHNFYLRLYVFVVIFIYLFTGSNYASLLMCNFEHLTLLSFS